jgi:hypothetical protein
VYVLYRHCIARTHICAHTSMASGGGVTLTSTEPPLTAVLIPVHEQSISRTQVITSATAINETNAQSTLPTDSRSFKRAILVWLTAQNSVHTLLVRYSRSRAVEHMFYASAAVFWTEAVKLVICLAAIVVEAQSVNRCVSDFDRLRHVSVQSRRHALHNRRESAARHG